RRVRRGRSATLFRSDPERGGARGAGGRRIVRPARGADSQGGAQRRLLARGAGARHGRGRRDPLSRAAPHHRLREGIAAMADELVFYTHPMSRGRIVRWLLEEIGQPYRTELLEYGTTMKSPEHLRINPMG